MGSTRTNNHEAVQLLKNCDFRKNTPVDQFQLPMLVKTVLFRGKWDETCLSKSQLGHLSDVESLDWFWDTAEEAKSQPDQKRRPASLFEIPPNDDRTKVFGDLICHFTTFEILSGKTTGKSFVRQLPVTPELMPFKQMSCPVSPKRHK